MTRRRLAANDANDGPEREEVDDRPPICPACGVTQGFVVAGEGDTIEFVCLECGWSERSSS